MTEFVSRYTLARGGLLLALLLPLLFVFRGFSIILLLFFGNLAFSYATVPLRKLQFGIELTTFLTIASAFAFGPVFGAAAGLALITAEYLGTRRLSLLAAVTVPSVIAMGIIAPSLSGLGFVTAGIILSVSYNIVTFALCLGIRQRAMGLIIFAVTNIFWNRFLFSAASGLF